MAKSEKVKDKKKINDENKKLEKVKPEKAKNSKKNKTKGVKKENFFVGVRSELSKVKWPSKKEVMKYTVSTIIFIVILVLFFILMSLIMSFVKGAFN